MQLYAFEILLPKRKRARNIIAHPSIPFRCLARSGAFEAHGNAHAAANAKRCKTLFRTTTPHLEEKRVQDTRARGADRVSDGNGAPIDVNN
jgi:hypothetical protein